MGSLKEELEKEPVRVTLATILEEMSPEDAKDLTEAIGDPSVPAASIYKALRRRGYTMTQRAINYWAREARPV